MKYKRRFTTKGQDVYKMFKYETRKSELRNTDGSFVFKMENVEVPAEWSQVATDILAQKYLRKTGIPQKDGSLGPETSIKQVVHRLAGTWQYWGKKYGYFDTEEDASAFYDELVYMMLKQMAAPNSPQWFNTGLNFAYGITGNKQGHYYVDPDTKEMKESVDAYSHPQPHACFIQSVKDDLINPEGIFDLAVREARIFKYGSGTGTNFSSLRGVGEKLSGGGYSSGLMSFLKIFDRAAGAIKSGGTTRRAAKMVIVNADHPDVEEFVEWKAKEEDKVSALVTGSRIKKAYLTKIVACALDKGTNPSLNNALNTLITNALKHGVTFYDINRVLSMIDQGQNEFDFEEFTPSFESEAYNTVSGQNSNNTVRVTNDYMKAVADDKAWDLINRTDGQVAKTIKARSLWNKISVAAWKSADPGIQFDTTINEWHTVPNSGRINASNPCSEYMFLDDSACNLASLNLLKFYNEDTQKFEIEDYCHAVRLWTVVLEISVLMAQFPSEKMAQISYDFRTLGLGYANLGSLLMVNGLPYDSKEALSYAGAITGLMTAVAYSTSAELAKEHDTFTYFDMNREEMLRVIRNHRRAAYNADDYESLSVRPRGIDPKYCPQYLLDSVRSAWDDALKAGEKYGFRNAQVTVMAPTGTIGLLMDCDTTGVEPDFAIVKFKKLAGGGYFKIVNRAVTKALKHLGYSTDHIKDIENYCKGRGSLEDCPYITWDKLKEKGFDDVSISKMEMQFGSAFHINNAINKWILGEKQLKTLGISDNKINSPQLNILREVGFTQEEIDKTNDYVCGTMMIEGAPHILENHLPIFDTANRCGKNGKRFIQYMAHVNMMSALQPFVSGAISKTVNMPSESTIAEIGDVYAKSWKLGLKAIALYRDNSKISQPLNSSIIDGKDETVIIDDDSIGPKEIQEVIKEKIVYVPHRNRLPKKRDGHIREAYIGGHKVFLRTGEYEDGKLGEIFIDMYKEGASFRGLLNSFAILTSKALQYGVPLEELVDTFTFTRFDPAGPVQGHEAIKYSTSILDYVFRSLGYDYLHRSDFVHVKAVDEDHVHIEEHADEQQPNPGKLPLATGESELFPETNPSSEKSIELFDAKVSGYTGEQCEFCGSIRVKRSGSCTVCEDCGSTTGCS